MTSAGIPTTDGATPTAMRRGAPLAGVLPVLLIRPIIAIVLVAVAVAASDAPVPRLVAAQDGSSLTLTLTASATKARVGEIVGFTARVENTGTVTIPDLLVLLGLPDALDSRAVNCPGDTSGSTAFCQLGAFAPGSVAEVGFFVEIGAREPNGPVTASASSGGTVLATAQVPQLKIVGPPHPK